MWKTLSFLIFNSQWGNFCLCCHTSISWHGCLVKARSCTPFQQDNLWISLTVLWNSMSLWVTTCLLVGKHEGVLKVTDVKSCLDPSSLKLVSANVEQERGRWQEGKVRWRRALMWGLRKQKDKAAWVSLQHLQLTRVWNGNSCGKTRVV